MSDLRRRNSTLVGHWPAKDWPLVETVAMDNKHSIEVCVTRQFSVSPRVIFDAGTISQTAGKWLFAAGQSVCVEIDALAGGWFYLAGRRNGEQFEYVGEFLEVVRPHRLVFALLAEKYSLNFERVTVVFDPCGSGCELGLTHETKPEFAQQSYRDWDKVLQRLAAIVSQTGRNAA